MGVDAIIFSPHPDPKAVERLGELQNLLREVTGDKTLSLGARPCPGHLDEKDASTIVSLNNYWRAYGVDYRRGSWPQMLMAILFIREHFGNVVYTHDHVLCSDDCRCCWPETTDADLEPVTQHWLRFAGRG